MPAGVRGLFTEPPEHATVGVRLQALPYHR